MALAEIKFNRGRGGLGRVRAGEDHVSSLTFFGTAPVGWPTDGIKAIFSPTEAESAGITSSAYPVERYHIDEFFRTAGSAELWVGFFADPVTMDFSELVGIESKSQGKVRQYGVYVRDAFTSGMVSALQSILEQFDGVSSAVGVLTADLSAENDLSTLDDLTGANDKVYVDIAQSGQGVGADLFVSESVSIGTVGATLGTIAAASVAESIAEVGQFDVAGNELDVLAFSNGDSYESKTLAELQSIAEKRYGFLRKYRGYAGSFFAHSNTCSSAGDYDSIEKNRVIGKAERIIRSALLPKLNSTVLINSDGSLQAEDVASYEELANAGLDLMIRNRELSAGAVTIDPTQDVLGTDELVIDVDLIPLGKATTISINISFTKQTA